MKETVSTYTCIGNTTDSRLKVVSLVAAYNISEKTNTMTDDKKFASKKDMHNTSTLNNEFACAADQDLSM